LWYNGVVGKFLRNAGLIIAGGLYIWVITILLENDNWVGISALTTMLLAIAAFLAIRQTRSIQRAEKRERQLKEIIEWATDITIYSLEGGVFDIVTLSQGLNADYILEQLVNDGVKNFRIAMAKSTNILTIASKVDQTLNEKVETLVKELRGQIKRLMDYRRDPNRNDRPENIKKLKNVAKYNENIINLASVVIEEAAKIKTKDIS